MTREEAVQMIRAHKFPKPTEAWQMLNNEAIDMAISALSAEPSDLISRAEVLSLFPNAFYDGLASQIKALPSADRPSGEWLDYDGKQMKKYAQYCGHCSVCGEWSEYLTDYCGNCGAYMADKGVEKSTFELNKECDGCRYDWGGICGNFMMAKPDHSCWTEPYKRGDDE